jgi:chemotaxis protein CheC
MIAPLSLDEMERDALTELVNIGVSRAATSLGTMVNQEILLSAPGVAIVTRHEAAQVLGGSGDTDLVAVHQRFEGDFAGQAMLVFPEINSLELIRAVTGGMLPLEDIIRLEQEALAETGNVILNCCLATIANMLRITLKMSLPEILRGSGTELFEPHGITTSENFVLMLYIDFSVRPRDIRGHISLLMDLPALTTLKALLIKFIERMTGEEPPANHRAL